jgi:P27 family predicted phage terminase small subunit
MTAKGRRPKPTYLRLVTGNPGRRPINGNEPKPESTVPEPPPELLDDARKEWDRLAVPLSKLGLLTELDRGVLAALCQAYGRWVVAERGIAALALRQPTLQGLLIKTTNGNMIQNPLVGIANKAFADYVRYAGEFGMTPSARSRISTAKDTGNDGRGIAETYFTR